jgi:hypothetical protein
MAKSTRSKVKRSFRAKKREDSAYAANEAARLQRLSAKLAAVASKDATQDEEVPLMDQTQDGEEKQALSGLYLSAALGLIDDLDITPDNMGILTSFDYQNPLFYHFTAPPRRPDQRSLFRTGSSAL